MEFEITIGTNYTVSQDKELPESYATLLQEYLDVEEKIIEINRKIKNLRVLLKKQREKILEEEEDKGIFI
jgi:hypothetical protein